MSKENNYHQIQALSVDQFNDLLKDINKNHRFGTSGKMIKYISPYYDNRTFDIYRVHFTYGIGCGKEFTTVNPETNPLQGVHDNLLDAINNWLCS